MDWNNKNVLFISKDVLVSLFFTGKTRTSNVFNSRGNTRDEFYKMEYVFQNRVMGKRYGKAEDMKNFLLRGTLTVVFINLKSGRWNE